MNKEEGNNMKSTAQLKSVIYISIIAALGGFLFGFDTAVIFNKNGRIWFWT